jgi:hypothetical protein
MKSFGNEIRWCSIRERSYVSSEDGMISNAARGLATRGAIDPLNPVPGTESAIAIFDDPGPGGPTDPKLDTYPPSTRWTLVLENQISRCPVGIFLGRAVDRTILWNNSFFETPTPVQDLARNTFQARSFVAYGGKLIPQPVQ